MIALRALGKSEITTATGKLTPSQGIVFATALYLFLERAKAVSRESLAEVLWPGAADAARQHRLRQTLLDLKHAGIPVQANREIVSLPAEIRQSDLDVLFIHGAGDIDSLESLQFLPGYAPSFSRSFSDWLDSKRSEVTAASGRLLINDIRKARARGDWIRVERLAVKCGDVDPFNEEAVLARAEASAMRGAKREAMTILDRYVADLGPGGGDLKLPASLMRRRIAERVPDAVFLNKTEGIFVGREADMQLLTSVLDHARAGRGRCCVLWGDAGIGKTRLAEELRKFGELQGVQVRRVGCRRGDAQRPLSVFVEAVPLLRDMRGALGCSPDTMADLQRLTQFDVRSEAKHALEMDPQSIFELIRLAIFDLIDAVSEEQPLMLVVEDVHWMDAASARILGQIADWAVKKHLLLLFTSRMLENPLLDACTRSGLVAHHVRALSNEAATLLVEEMFDATNEQRDDEFLEWCRRVGDGNPFFLHELVKQWMETKQRHAIPPSLTAVIRDRFSRLSSEGTQLLQACATLGEHSTLPRIEKMLHQEPYMLLGAINELSKAAMLSPERKPSATSPDFKLAPKHDLISMVAQEELDPHAEVFLNRRAAGVLESELGAENQDTGLLWACVRHWQKAGEETQGASLAKHFADHLINVGHPQEGAEILGKLIASCSDQTERSSLTHRRLEALELASDWKAICSDIAAMRDLTPSPDLLHDDYELTYFDALWRNSFDFASLVKRLMICVLEESAPPAHRVRAGNLALKAASDLGDPTILDSIFEAIAPLFGHSGVAAIEHYEAELVFHCNNGDSSCVPSLAQKLIQAAQAHGNRSRLAGAMRNAGLANLKCGFNSEALELLERNVEELAAAKLIRQARHASLELVRVYLDLGETALARTWIEKFDHDPFPSGDSTEDIRRSWAAAKLAIAESDLTGALAHFELIEKVPRDQQTNAWRTATLAIRVRLEILRNAPAEIVVGIIEELVPVFAKNKHLGRQDYEAISLVTGLEYLGKSEQARKIVLDYLTVRKERNPVPERLLRASNATGDGSSLG
jgi:DNA-binding SARP family transcriptional activator/tetratricopeptide (TPR) repeat protein